MQFDFNKASATANKIIAKYGTAGTVTREGSTGGFDAGGNPKPDQPDVNISGTITPIIKYKNQEVDGTEIIKGDGWCLFDSEDEPETGMTTTVNGVLWRVVNVETLESPTGIVIRRLLHLRK